MTPLRPLLVAVAVALAAAAPAAANESLNLPPDGAHGRSLAFTLPAGARQGPSRWYLVRLHFRATLSPSTRSGDVFVNASTNGRAAEMVELKVRREPGAAPRIAWNSLDLLRGPAKGVVRGRTIELDVQNYLQDTGVRPGRNVLSFDLDRMGGARLARVHVFADSGVRASSRSPAHLVLNPAVAPRSVHAGDEFDVGYTVLNDGERPAMGVAIGAEMTSDALEVSGDRTIGTLASGASRSGHLRVRARRSGRFSLGVVADSANTNRPLAEIAVPVHSRPAPARAVPGPPLPLVAGLMLFGLMVAMTVRFRARAQVA